MADTVNDDDNLLVDSDDDKSRKTNPLINKHVKITSVQNDKIVSLSNRSGYNQNEIFRLLIDNLDEVKIGLLSQSNRNKLLRHQNEMYATVKYFDYLSNNIANNLNQIAKKLNSGSGLNDNMKLLLQSILNEQIKMRRKVDDFYERNNR